MMLSQKLQAAIVNSYGFNREQKQWLNQYVKSILDRNPKLFVSLLLESDRLWGEKRAMELHKAARYFLDSVHIEWVSCVIDTAIQLKRLENQLH